MVTDPVMSACKHNLRWHIDQEWDALRALINRLSLEQLTVPTDDGGWTAKDHLIHVAVWQEGLNAVLNRRSFADGMGLDSINWADIDAVNAVIQARCRELPLMQVMHALSVSHDHVLRSLDALADGDLNRPVSEFDPDSDERNPLLNTIVCHSFGHYDEHREWIEALAS